MLHSRFISGLGARLLVSETPALVTHFTTRPWVSCNSARHMAANIVYQDHFHLGHIIHHCSYHTLSSGANST